MSIAETVLYFVGIPAAVVATVAALTYAGGARRSKRYRPGRPYDFTPVWFTAGSHATTGGAGRHELTRHGERAQDAEGTVPALPGAGAAVGMTGGASDRW